MTRSTVNKVVKAIIADLTDRRGLRQAWEEIDGDVRAEIRAAWRKIVKECSDEEGNIPSASAAPDTEGELP